MKTVLMMEMNCVLLTVWSSKLLMVKPKGIYLALRLEYLLVQQLAMQMVLMSQSSLVHLMEFCLAQLAETMMETGSVYLLDC